MWGDDRFGLPVADAAECATISSNLADVRKMISLDVLGSRTATMSTRGEEQFSI